MQQPKPFDVDAHAAEAVKAANENPVGGGDAPLSALPEIPQPAAQAAAQPVFEEGAALRHGRVAAKSLNVALRNLTGEGVDDDTHSTFGDLFGEVFNLLNKFGNRGIYMGVLFAAFLPVVGVVIYQFNQREKKGSDNA